MPSIYTKAFFIGFIKDCLLLSSQKNYDEKIINIKYYNYPGCMQK